MTDIDTAEGREEWRPVSGYEGFYEVSDQGRVRSVDRIVPHRSGMTAVKGRILSPSRSTKRGYLTVRLTRDGKSASKQVHRLLAEAFIANPDVLPFVLHGDDDPANNGLDNLRWGNARQNMLDRELNGNGNATRRRACCPKGHEYTPENTYLTRTGWRRCRQCTNEGQARRYRERKAAR